MGSIPITCFLNSVFCCKYGKNRSFFFRFGGILGALSFLYHIFYVRISSYYIIWHFVLYPYFSKSFYIPEIIKPWGGSRINMIRDITQLVSPHPEPPSKDCHFDRSLTCSLNHSLFQEEQGPCGALVSSQRVISSLLPPTIPRLRTLIGKTGYVLQLLSQDPEPPLKDSCFFTASSKLCQRNKYYLGKLSKT